jgi:hypothetical protein
VVVAPGKVAVDPILVDRDVDVAAVCAARADGRDISQEPDADLEAEILAGERSDRADVAGADRVAVVEGLSRECGDDGRVGAAQHGELAGLGDLAAEAHAPSAEDAALLVEEDAGSDVDPLPELALGLLVAAVGDPVIEAVVLQLALPRLIADRAVERMVDQEQLHHGPPSLLHPLRLGVHHHPFHHRRVTGDLELRYLLDLHLAHPAGAVDLELRVPAEVRDLDSVRLRHLQDGGARFRRDLLPVDREFGHSAFPASRPRRPG